MVRRAFTSVLFLALLPLAQADFTLTLIHTNDLHAHMEPVKVGGVELGGYARQATLIKAIRQESKNTLLVNAGDTFQGTLFFNVYHGLADLAFMNSIGYQAMTVGNHEFDLGPKALLDFARLASFPIISSNLDLSAEPELQQYIRPGQILAMHKDEAEKDPDAEKAKEAGGEGEQEENEVRVGLVGAVTPDLPSISSPGDTIKMKPLVPSVQRAIDDLRLKKVKIIILLSHCGYDEDLKLAKALHGVDVIVGGHSHTLLGDTKLPGDPTSAGPYPTVVKNADGETALIVQSWEWGKVLGKLEVKFDDEGKVEEWSKDQPIEVGPDVSPDPAVNAMIAAFKKPIEALMNKEVGSTISEIPRNGPGIQGPMADMICDAMLDATRSQGSVIALMNAGGVRSALNAGKITYGDAIAVQPFNNTLVVLDLTGAELKTALASGVLFVSKGSSFSLGKGNTVSSVIVAGQPVDAKKTYRCTFNSFTAKGGDGLDVLKNAKGHRYDTGLLDVDALLDYVKTHSPLKLSASGRIKG